MDPNIKQAFLNAFYQRLAENGVNLINLHVHLNGQGYQVFLDPSIVSESSTDDAFLAIFEPAIEHGIDAAFEVDLRNRAEDRRDREDAR